MTHIPYHNFIHQHTSVRTTVEPHYNEVLETMKIRFLIAGFKKIYIKSWDQQNDLVISDLFILNEFPLYKKLSVRDKLH